MAYDSQLWGTTSNSNIAILERFQSKVLLLIVNAPWYVPNPKLGLNNKKIKLYSPTSLPSISFPIINTINQTLSHYAECNWKARTNFEHKFYVSKNKLFILTFIVWVICEGIWYVHDGALAHSGRSYHDRWLGNGRRTLMLPPPQILFLLLTTKGHSAIALWMPVRLSAATRHLWADVAFHVEMWPGMHWISWRTWM
jgi:hypothetical protein